jgi:hypothetical protein
MDTATTVDQLNTRELIAFINLNQAVHDAEQADAVVYGLDGHDPDSWTYDAKHNDPDGYRAYVEALEVAVDDKLTIAHMRSDDRWRQLLGSVTP